MDSPNNVIEDKENPRKWARLTLDNDDTARQLPEELVNPSNRSCFTPFDDPVRQLTNEQVDVGSNTQPPKMSLSGNPMRLTTDNLAEAADQLFDIGGLYHPPTTS